MQSLPLRRGRVRTRPPLPGRRLLSAVLLCLLGCTALLLGGAAPAGAHAALLGSDPKPGAVVRTPPTRVSLTFSEQVTMEHDALRVLDPAGRRVSTGPVSSTASDTYTIRLRTGSLPHGTYTVAYQVVSADSHPVAGAYTFSVGAPSGPGVRLPATAHSAGGGVLGGLYDTARYVSYAGFVLLVGGSVFVLACWPRGSGVRPVQRLVVAGWVAMTAATLALLLMRGAYTGSGRVADVLDLGLLSGVLHTKPGTALVCRLLLLAVAALFVAVLFGAYARRIAAGGTGGADPADPGGDAGAGGDGGAEDGGKADASGAEDDGRAGDLGFGLAVGGAVVAIGLAATWATSEHASVGLQPRIAMPVDVLHLLAVAVWLGGLVALLTVLHRAWPIEAAAVRRFSALAFGSVLVLVATGVYQSWRQVGSWSALTDTGFGQLLLVKVALVAVVVAIASSSRRWTHRLKDAPVASGASAVAVPSGTTEPSASSASSGPSAPVTTGTLAAPAPATLGTHAEPAPEPAAASGAPGIPAEAPAPVTTTADTDRRPASGGAPDVGTPTGATDTPPVTSPERAAQLARQQAAREAAHRRRLRDADPVRSALRRSVLAEAVVAVAVLAVTTVLTTTETGRTAEQARAGGAAAAQQQAGPVSLDLPYDTGGGPHRRGSVMLDLTPSHPGRNDLHIMVMDRDGRAVDIPEVVVRLTLPAQHLGPLRITPRHTGTGRWSAPGVQIPMAGDWRFDVTVRTSEIDEVTVQKNAKIG